MLKKSDKVSSRYEKQRKHEKSVDNSHKLISAEERIEQIKKECRVTCAGCGGDGKVACRLCGGSGSRRVNHTTPNGKTWQVHQECKTTSSCGDCHGKGGEYIEE